MNFIANMMRPKGDPKIRRSGPGSLTPADRLAKTLGWVSIGLGLTELFASRKVARALGMRGQEGLIRGFGAREIGSGILCLSVDKKAGLVSRIGGDALDYAVLRQALHPMNPKRENVALALCAVAGIAALDLLATKLVFVRHARDSGSKRHDYSDRSGFPGGVAKARGLARQRGQASPSRSAQAV